MHRFLNFPQSLPSFEQDLKFLCWHSSKHSQAIFFYPPIIFSLIPSSLLIICIRHSFYNCAIYFVSSALIPMLSILILFSLNCDINSSNLRFPIEALLIYEILDSFLLATETASIVSIFIFSSFVTFMCWSLPEVIIFPLLSYSPTSSHNTFFTCSPPPLWLLSTYSLWPTHSSNSRPSWQTNIVLQSRPFPIFFCQVVQWP